MITNLNTNIMSTIIFLLVFYYVFSALVVLGTVVSDTSYKWYEIMFLSLSGFVLLPIIIGMVIIRKR